MGIPKAGASPSDGLQSYPGHLQRCILRADNISEYQLPLYYQLQLEQLWSHDIRATN